MKEELTPLQISIIKKALEDYERNWARMFMDLFLRDDIEVPTARKWTSITEIKQTREVVERLTRNY